MQSIQYDVVSLQALDLLEVFLPHLPEGAIKDRLSAWDGSYAPDRVEPSIFTQLYRNVLLEIFGHEEGIGWHRMLYLITRVGFSTMVLYCIDRLLARDASLWWAARDKAALIRRAAERIEPGAAVPWSKTNAFSFSNRFFPRRRVGRALGFHTREVAMPGCAATPFQGHLLRAGRRESTFAPSYHFVADMGRDEAWTNLPGGPSESRFSSYYTSDISLWCEGKYKRLTPEG
jgi:penicillin amidase